MTTVITFGTFDVFHIGHVNMLIRARALGDRLIVGVSTDRLNFAKKGRYPVYHQEHRMEIVRSLECVDAAFMERSLEAKRSYVTKYKADVLVMGDDWRGRFDDLADICTVRYLPRTADVSTTEIIADIRLRDPE